MNKNPNDSNELNEFLNEQEQNQTAYTYPQIQTPTQSQVLMEINRHQDVMFYLRQISENTANRRRHDENHDAANTIVLFLVTLFLIYMGIGFYRAGGFETLVGPKLFFMIIAIFITMALLHREETKIIKKMKH